MTERKPPGMNFESWVDKQVRDGAGRGLFDDLPGTGKPLPDRREPQGALSWVTNKIREEGLDSEALLPPPLRLRKEVERLAETVRTLPTERAVRDAVLDLNHRIAECLRAPAGPAVPIGPVDVDSVVQQWRTERGVTQSRQGQSRQGQSTSDGKQNNKHNITRCVLPWPRRWWFRRRRQRS